MERRNREREVEKGIEDREEVEDGGGKIDDKRG